MLAEISEDSCHPQDFCLAVRGKHVLSSEESLFEVYVWVHYCGLLTLDCGYTCHYCSKENKNCRE